MSDDIRDRIKAAALSGWRHVDAPTSWPIAYLRHEIDAGFAGSLDVADGHCEVEIDGRLTPSELRSLAAQLLAVADAIEPTKRPATGRQPVRYSLVQAPSFRAVGPWHDSPQLDDDPRKATTLLAAASVDANAFAIVWLSEWEHTAHFVLFDVVHFGYSGPGHVDDIGHPDAYALHDMHAVDNMTTTDDIGRAGWIAGGSIKWDGCCNFEWYPTTDCLAHGCGGLDHFERLTKQWAVAFSLAATLMPKHGNEYLPGQRPETVIEEEPLAEAQARAR